jgi:hypothetical protein
MSKIETLDDMTSSKYMRATDVVGSSFTAHIVRIEQETMRDGTEKLVAYFKGHQKGIVLNATKGKVLAGMAKSKFRRDWVGLEVHVSGGTAELGGEEVPSIKFSGPTRAAVSERGDEPPPHTSIPDDLGDAVPY